MANKLSNKTDGTIKSKRFQAISRRGSVLLVKLVQALCAQVTSGQPEVLVLKPILVLHRAEFASQQRRSCFAVLVHYDAILKKAPNPINDLTSRFHFQCLLSAKDLVGHDVDMFRVQPPELAIHLHPLHAVNHFVVQNSPNFLVVTFR